MGEPMRALTLWQPWASALVASVDGERLKGLETRSWPVPSTLPMPFTMAVHASQRRFGVHSDEVDLVLSSPRSHWCALRDAIGGYPASARCYPLGKVVGTVRVVDCVPIVSTSEAKGDRDGRSHVLSMAGKPCLVDHNAETLVPLDDQLGWGDFTPGRWAWITEDPVMLDEPIPCRGRQGLWRLPADIEEQLG